MSLIHDALREQDGAALPPRPAPRASWWARQPASARGPLLFTAAGLAGFLLAGALLLTFGKRGEAGPSAHAGRPDVASPAVPTVATIAAEPAVAAAPSASPAVVRTPEPGLPYAEATMAPQAPEGLAPTAIAGQAEHPQPNAGRNAEPAPAAPTPSPAALSPTPATATSDAAAPAIRIKVERRSGTAPADTGMENRGVEQAVADVESAMTGGDLGTARQALARLDALLPPESLTLLRMQAWIAHAGNDTARAETLYRRIAERVPEDVNAGVNIALLDARRGDADAARQRLTRLSGRYPRSPQVARALAELDSTAP